LRLRLTDHSEKARIPAWTDRVLRKGTNLRQISYGTAPLRFSDHRPVFATFQCTVSIIDETIRESLSQALYEKRRADVGGAIASSRTDDTDDEDLIGYDAIEPGLPPASSDRRKWWLENGQPARSSVQPPGRGAIPNPNRLTNPFAPSDEPDWVTIPKPIRTNTTESFQSTASSIESMNPRGRGPIARKLPPPFSPTGSVHPPTNGNNAPRTANINTITATNTSAATAPPTRRPSDSNTSRSSSSLSKKAPPPVAKKPVHLTSNSPVMSANGGYPPPNQNPQTLPVRSMTGVQTEFPPPPRRATGFDGAQQPPPPQPRRSGASRTPTESKDDGGPRLPPRPVDLLNDDDHDTGLKGWEVLKPT
jgi:hypothetical protein